MLGWATVVSKKGRQCPRFLPSPNMVRAITGIHSLLIIYLYFILGGVTLNEVLNALPQSTGPNFAGKKVILRGNSQ